MNGDPLPPQDHISRYCKPKTLINGKPSGPSFMLRSNEPYLSVNWMERTGFETRHEQINCIKEKIQLNLAPTGLFAILNIEMTIEHINSKCANANIAILHKPTPEDDSHSGIHGYSHEDDMVTDLLAEEVIETWAT